MFRRAVSGAIFVILILGATLNQWAFLILLFLISMIGLREFFKLVREKSIFPSVKFGILGGCLVYFASVMACLDYPLSHSLWVVTLLPAMLVLELYRNKKHPFANAAIAIFGWMYIVVPLALINGFWKLAHPSEYDYLIPAGYFLLVWMNDTGAYIFGKTFGKRKLFERISPNKTWEGSIAGVLLAIVVGYFLGEPIFLCSAIEGALLGLIVGVVGTFGDLVESMFKRSVGVKDSGTIMPGHGGVLDRFDAVILSSPLVFLYLQLINS